MLTMPDNRNKELAKRVLSSRVILVDSPVLLALPVPLRSSSPTPTR